MTMAPKTRRLAALTVLVLAACSRNEPQPAPAAHAEGQPQAEHQGHAIPSPAAAGVRQAEHQGHALPSPASPGAVQGMAEVEIPAERRQMTGVRTVVLGRESLTSHVRTVGLVAEDERRIRHMHTKVSGWIQDLAVSFTGQQVKVGQPIFSIYSPELLAAQREYLIARQAARAAFEPGSADERQMRSLLESARARLGYWDLTKAQVEELERTGEVRRTVTLHSPAAGFVTLKPVYAGMYVTPEMELYTIADLRSVWVWADIYEDEISLVQLGQEAAITVGSMPGKPIPAVVTFINPAIEPSTRTLRVRFDVANEAGLLKPGMFATVELDTKVGDVLALPEDAVIDTGTRKVVFVEVAPGRFQPREVTLGRKAASRYEVLAGLRTGDAVVMSAQFLLDSESRLRAASGGPVHGGH